MAEGALKPTDYAVLSRIARELKAARMVERKRSLKAIVAIEAFCDAHDIRLDDYRRGDTLRFDRRLLGAIDTTLQELGHRPIDATTRGRSTREQAVHGLDEDKANRAAPRQARVLVSAPASTTPAWLATTPREIRDLDWRDLTLAAFDALVQVENLDSFYELDGTLGALGEVVAPLVVYRGDTLYRQGFDALAAAWGECFHDQRPHLYLGDFDAAGIAIALASGASHLLLPSLATLADKASGLHQPAEQMPHQTALRRHRERLAAAHPLRDYLALILDQQRGLRQQWFAGPLEAVALR